MTFIGKIKEVFPVVEMTINEEVSKKIEFLLEIESGKFPRSIAVEVWNGKINNPNIRVGNNVLVVANLKARRVKDRFFNNITASKIDLIN